MKILTLDEIENPNLNILIYAPPGHGKTRLSGTIARVTKPLFLSAESGLLSLRKLGKEIKENFNFMEIKEYADLEVAYKYLMFDKEASKYGAVCMDSITEIQKVCMDAILKAEGREKPMIQDWGTLNQKMVSLIRAFRDMPKHFIATCLADRDKDEETGTTWTMPLVQGGLQKSIDGYFDEVVYLHAKEFKDAAGKVEVKRWLQTQGTNNIRAKDRSGMLDAAEPADLKGVYDKIIGKPKPKAEEPKQEPKPEEKK